MIEDVLRHWSTETEMDTEKYRKLILNIPRVYHKIEAPYEQIRYWSDESEKNEVCFRTTGSQTFGSRSLIKEWLNTVFYEKVEIGKLEYALNPLGYTDLNTALQQKGFENFTRESLKPINDLVVGWKNRYSSVDEICIHKEEMKEVVEHIKKMEEELDC